ncbi:MAG TPA: carboxypeptidase-like regulatory domain-containing protein [Longimicrobium sp.]|jgi:anti-sigma factor RsiW
MQHVDEGRLHAWLDGELPDEERAVERHLEDCEACRARADEERRIRAAASSILLGADPGEIAMRRMVAVPAARRPRRWVAVGWAASVLLALGIGWVARPSEREPVAIAPAPAPRAPEAAQSATGTAPAPESVTQPAPSNPAAQAAPVATDFSAPAREEGAVQADAAPAREAAARVESAPAEVPAPVASVAVVPMPQAAPPPPPPLPASPPPAARRARSAAEAQPSAAPPPPAAELANETVTLRGRVISAESGEALAGAQVSVPTLRARTVTRADGSYDLTLPAERLAGSETIQVQATVVGRAAQSRVVAVESGTANFAMPAQAVALEGVVVTSDAVRWRPSAQADAERQLRHPLVIIPGLEVLGVDVGRMGGRTAVRVRQRLPGGETLSLTQRRASARADTTGITIRRGNLIVEATAPIPADSIRKLLP